MLTSGLKIFVLNSDLSSLVINSLQMQAFLNGYEVYFYIAHTGSEIEEIIKIVSDFFEESLILINIDRKVNGISSYLPFISRLNQEYLHRYQTLDADNVKGNCIRIGIIHSINPNRINRETELGLERVYLENAKPSGGFFCLDINQHRNAENFIDYLDSYEYLRGYKRHTVRYVCKRTSERIKYYTGNGEREHKLLDISISHFSIIVPKPITLQLYAKIRNVQIYMKSAIFKTDCLLTLIRETGNREYVYVFIFLHAGASCE